MAPTPKVLLVGWDGVRHDHLAALDLPTLSAVAADGLLARTEMPDTTVAKTVTAPGWSTILTGVWPDKHGITDNVAMPHHFDRWPHLMQRLVDARPATTTAAFACAAMLGSTKGPGPILAGGISRLVFHDVRLDPAGPLGRDPLVHADAVEHLAHRPIDLAFVYYASTDKSAHLHGATSAEYAAAIRRQDAWTGELIAALRSRPTLDEEDWLIAVTTDHGHRDEGGHGGDSWQERQTFLALGRLDGALGFGAGQPAQVDLAPTLLAHLGVDPDPAWELDGTALQGSQQG